MIAHSESEKHRKIAVGEKGIKEGRRGGEGKIGDKRKGEEAAIKEADEANTEKWEKKVQDLQVKIKAMKGFIEEQNNILKTALAKGETMKSANALRHNLRAAEFSWLG